MTYLQWKDATNYYYVDWVVPPTLDHQEWWHVCLIAQFLVLINGGGWTVDPEKELVDGVPYLNSWDYRPGRMDGTCYLKECTFKYNWRKYPGVHYERP